MRVLCLLGVLLFLVACSEEPAKVRKEPDWDRLTSADSKESKRLKQQAQEQQAAPKNDAVSPGLENAPPRISTVKYQVNLAVLKSDITLTVTGSDADGDDVEYSYQWFVNDEELYEETTSVLSAQSYQRGDQVEAVVTGTDGFSESRPYRTLIVFPDALPQITSRPSENFKTLDYTYQVVAKDPDDGELTYSLEDAPEGMTIDAESGLITWSLRGVKAGHYSVTIAVENAAGKKGIQKFDMDLGEPEPQEGSPEQE
ncbi:MAG: Ig domain-containing protein [Desulfuromonadales bacterium]|nr:Ig domain-containing protein [Desulfuromonadales bacterium]